MMKSKLLDFAAHLPNGFNHVLMNFNNNPSRIYGKKYSNYKVFVRNNSKHYDNSNDLLKLVNHAIKYVPYYRKRYKKIKTVSEFLDQFEFTDKDIISNNFDDLLDENIDKSKFALTTTSGSSGNPLKMYVPKDRYIVELGTMHSLWEEVGFNNQVRAVIRNRKLKNHQDYIINPITKEIIFDGFRLNNNYFQKIYDTIKKNQTPFIHAYPSTALEFSKFIVENNLDISFVRSFLSGSENIYDFQIDYIRNKVNINFYNWYGHSEKLILGGYCKGSDNYHIEPTYGFFELIDNSGNQINVPGETGEIVGTTLHNKGMPIIRYKTGDYAEYVGDYCKYCKRHVPLIRNIQGRREGLKIYGADGSSTTTTALNFHDDLYLVLAGLQYVQKEMGKLDILVIKGDNFKEEHNQRLKAYYGSKFSEDTKINIIYVDKLLRKSNGKFVELISDINH